MIMGFFGNIISAAVKVAITPIAIVKDVVSIATGDEPNNTKSIINSATDDLSDAIDDIT